MADVQPDPAQDFWAENGRTILIGALIVIAALVAYKFRPRSTFAADGLSPRWDATVEQSRAAHMPALVLFTADWCPACQALHGETLSDQRVADEINGHYMMMTVNLTAQGPAAIARARRYGVSGIPALIRFDAEGNETARTHYIPPDRMVEWLKEGE